MRKMEVCKKVMNLGTQTQQTLTYFITVDEMADQLSGTVIEQYGVGVSIMEAAEESSVRRITVSADKIRRLSDLLASNMVTPVALRDVIDDWVSR